MVEEDVSVGAGAIGHKGVAIFRTRRRVSARGEYFSMSFLHCGGWAQDDNVLCPVDDNLQHDHSEK